jgi:hypothetical protein
MFIPVALANLTGLADITAAADRLHDIKPMPKPITKLSGSQ